jgi:predicted  nucleic acid-binding Zn-ribbon protein
VPCTPEEAEHLRKVSELASTLNARAELGEEHAKKTVDRLEAVQTKMNDTLYELKAEFAALKERLNGLEEDRKEYSRRKFTVLQGILLAVVGSVLALAGNFGLTYLKAYLDHKP